MRARLLRSSLLVVAVAVLLVGVPVLVVGAVLVHRQALGDLNERAEAIAVVVQAREDAIDLRQIDAILAAGPTGSRMRARILVGTRDEVQAGPVPVGRTYAATRRVGEVSVRVDVPRSSVDAAVLELALVVVGFAVVAFAAAVALALWQARRLTAPLAALAENADRVGLGQSRLLPVASGVAELDRVAAGLERSAESMAVALAAERDFATDAGHQLRTPLTALSMRLEEIGATDRLDLVREEARIALNQVERLTQVVDDLLVRARSTRRRPLSDLDLDLVLVQQVEEWTPAFGKARRRVVRGAPSGARVLASTGALSQVVATLLENSLQHGAGTTTVTARRSGRSVVVEVGDEGPGVPPELGARIFERTVSSSGSTGLGLALARDLAEADGGRLELVRARPPVFALFLNEAG